MNAEIIAAIENLPYEDWLELRKNGIGGSDAAAVCGISRYKVFVNNKYFGMFDFSRCTFVD